MSDVKDVEWEKMYDGETDRHTRCIEPMADRKVRLYNHEWIIKNTREGDHVLDVGCSDGELCYLLKEFKRHPAGIDVSPRAIEIAKGHQPNVPFQQAYAEQIPYQDELFDVVCSTEMLEHVKDPLVCLKEMIRVLKKGGRLLFTVPIETNLANDGKSLHIHFWDHYKMMTMMDNFGEGYKIFYLNKFGWYDQNTDEPAPKNIYGVMYIKPMDGEVQ
jgi:ubiquinone/menaquinone biosynthesis C-methylase UbiE